jgi:UDP-N-acetylmuramate dehydrogenase
MEIRRNVELKNFATFKIGGAAKYFCVAKNKEDLLRALDFAKENKIKLFILGGGSNLLISDKGFDGLVIKIDIIKIECKDNLIFSGAGASLNSIAKMAQKNNLTGFEWAFGIPGASLGGAIFGNAQAFGSRMQDCVKEVEVFDAKNKKLAVFSKDQCSFSLKNSIFKKNKNLIIISAVLQLAKGEELRIKQKTQEYMNHRKLAHPMDFPSAGSVFVNPEMVVKNKNLIKKYPEFEKFNRVGVVPAGFLIERCGLKGKKIGKAQISEKHANFIINLGGAKAKDVVKLINLAKQKVRQKFGINLVIEIQILK